MTVIHAKAALLPGGWASNVRVDVQSGRIAKIETGVAAQPGDEHQTILVSGMPNLHSHAFQRGMAGLAEIRGPGADSFWSWRTIMYQFALSMTPDQVEAVAAQLYVEMLEAGFTRVGEFHYLHHDIDGKPYADIAEMGARIAAASQRSGIRLTLLPVFYAHSGFGGGAPTDGQRRFINDLDAYGKLLEGCQAATKGLDGAVVGVAPHSLRAATPEELAVVAKLAPDAPIHIHIAEQVKEVEDCLAWSGARPVEWLLKNAEVDQRWCLIHATHMTDQETRGMARAGAIAGLCPITEANLGDGIFNGVTFFEDGGRFGVGSDSNVLIGVADELRQFEYSQRLLHRARNVLAPSGGSTGRRLFDDALNGGAIALGAAKPELAVGAPADFVSLDAGHPALVGRRDDALLDSWIFAGNNTAIDGVWVAGRKLVSGGRHHARETVLNRFRKVMSALAAQ